MYCGDDVSSVVFDIGSYNIRTGYSGEDCPRSVIPSNVGVLQTDRDGDANMESNEKGGTQYVVGSSALSFRRDNMDVQNIYDKDGLINFDALD